MNSMVFEFTPEGIERMKSFMGDHFGRADIDQVPNSVPWMSIKNFNDKGELWVTQFASEGDFIMKREDGSFCAVKWK